MAIKLHAAYSKKAGLPGYSSHQFSVSIETELQNLDNVAAESARLYESLQSVVDRQLQQTGFVPPDGYGMNGNTSHSNGHSDNDWQCSGKQREFIERIIRENNRQSGRRTTLTRALRLRGQVVESSWRVGVHR
jgi:hypothetical protein